MAPKTTSSTKSSHYMKMMTLGKVLGYPECCVTKHVQRSIDESFSGLPDERQRKAMEKAPKGCRYHWIPCMDCATEIIEGRATFESLLTYKRPLVELIGTGRIGIPEVRCHAREVLDDHEFAIYEELIKEEVEKHKTNVICMKSLCSKPARCKLRGPPTEEDQRRRLEEEQAEAAAAVATVSVAVAPSAWAEARGPPIAGAPFEVGDEVLTHSVRNKDMWDGHTATVLKVLSKQVQVKLTTGPKRGSVKRYAKEKVRKVEARQLEDAHTGSEAKKARTDASPEERWPQAAQPSHVHTRAL